MRRWKNAPLGKGIERLHRVNYKIVAKVIQCFSTVSRRSDRYVKELQSVKEIN